MPPPFFEPPFDEAMASIVWSKPMPTKHGPLEDVPAAERARDWPRDKVVRLERLLPLRTDMAATRYNSCAVVGSSPELLLYEDGRAIDAHDAVFRANLAVVDGFEAHAGKRTSVRVINPVESVIRARRKDIYHSSRTMIVKNQDPPAIRSPSKEHSRFLEQSEEEIQRAVASAPLPPNYLARRAVLELCNYLMLASIDADADEGRMAPAAEGGVGRKQGSAKAHNLTSTTAAFRAYAAGRATSWHPNGDAIPKFSKSHCSTGTVLLLQALLTCRHVELYGYHACSCEDKCKAPKIATRNHYWDKKTTPRFGEMFARYESHMQLYQRLEKACDVSFRIARREHCDLLDI